MFLEELINIADWFLNKTTICQGYERPYYRNGLFFLLQRGGDPVSPFTAAVKLKDSMSMVQKERQELYDEIDAKIKKLQEAVNNYYAGKKEFLKLPTLPLGPEYHSVYNAETNTWTVYRKEE